MHRDKVVAVVGPTASGKSDLGIALAERFGGEVVSADSRQVYVGMDLGTGKVEGTRLPHLGHTVHVLGRAFPLLPLESCGVWHWLLDVVDPREWFTVAEFQALASHVIETIQARQHVAVMVGGTGLYLRAVLEGLQIPEVPPDAGVRRLALADLQLQLRMLDPAAEVDWQNPRRLMRALEIVRATGKPLAASRRVHPPPFTSLVLGLNPPGLTERIHRRLLARLDAGMIEEVQGLLAHGVTPERLEAFGLEYRYVGRLLAGRLDRARMVEELERAIVQYARRQMTWFRKYGSVQWVADEAQAQELAERFLTA
ncbi:MAG: tRNA (adenosine(37)-N6)-dimethylallyltransferase [Candidatus Xenobia bacterium]